MIMVCLICNLFSIVWSILVNFGMLCDMVRLMCSGLLGMGRLVLLIMSRLLWFMLVIMWESLVWSSGVCFIGFGLLGWVVVGCLFFWLLGLMFGCLVVLCRVLWCVCCVWWFLVC